MGLPRGISVGSNDSHEVQVFFFGVQEHDVNPMMHTCGSEEALGQDSDAIWTETNGRWKRRDDNETVVESEVRSGEALGKDSGAEEHVVNPTGAWHDWAPSTPKGEEPEVEPAAAAAVEDPM